MNGKVSVDFVPPGDKTSSRPPPKVPKRKHPVDVTPFRSFGRKASDGIEVSAPTASTRTLPKSNTSTPRVLNAECEVVTPPSLNVEAACSSLREVIPAYLCEVLLAFPVDKTSETQSPGSGLGSMHLGNVPVKFTDLLNSRPTPFESQSSTSTVVKPGERNRLEPKNVKKMERSAQQVALSATIAGPKRILKPLAANSGDPMGIPLFVIFHPENFFISYDEHTFDTNFNTDIFKSVRSVKSDPLMAAAEDCRALTLFLTVTSDCAFFNSMTRYPEDYLISGNYVLDWNDLKIILINFGLTRDYGEFDCASYYACNPPKSPKLWNFQFFFMVLGYSFPSYRKKRLERLVNFLSDCLFDPLLQQCHHDIVVLLRLVLKHLLQHGATLEDLVPPLNQSHLSWICNRVIIQHLAPDPLLKPLARTMAYRTIHGILGVDYLESSNELSHIADLMADFHSIREKTVVKYVYQLIAICENLVAMSSSPFDCETKTFLEKLADFAEHMSLSFTYFENLYFTDTVTRLRTLSAISIF